MMQPYDYDQWDRWTQRVRRATSREMNQVRLQRARAVHPVAPGEPMAAQVRHWWQFARTILWGGIPMIEQWIIDWLVPRPKDAEQALSPASASPAQRNAA